MPTQTTVLARRQGRIGRITLDRPRALHALDLGMIRALAAALDEWEGDPAVHAVVIESSGGRAFCAGGDVRGLRELSMAGDVATIRAFFAEEYALNLHIARYRKPYVALIDGVCMGGGIGVSVHGPIRVAGPGARFAMPETGIGFFPDIGATFILPRLRGAFGMYLALTGAQVEADDAAWLGLATHRVPSLDGLADAIAESGIAALADFAVPRGPAPLAAEDASAFAAPSVPEVLAALEAAGTGWARRAVETIRGVSPSAVLLTFDAVRAGAARTLEQCFAAELELACAGVRHPDFIEGVRAAVVDKDRAPRWSPATLEEALSTRPRSEAQVCRPGSLRSSR